MAEKKENTEKKKSFIHSTAFKCIIVLLIIVLISGIFLTICNSLFYVSDQERTDRAAKTIYGETVSTQEEQIDETVSLEDAKVEIVYTIAEYPEDYLISVTGSQGFSGGTVTCYVCLNVGSDDEITIKNVVISSNSGQSYISKVKTKALEGFMALFGIETDSTKDYYMLYSSEKGFYVESPNSVSNHLTTGATYSMQAICNAVNGAVEYVKQAYLGHEAATTPYDSYLYTDYINKSETTHSVSGTDVTYTIVTKGNGKADPFTLTVVVGSDKTVKSIDIVVNGSTLKGDTDYKDSMTDISTYVGKSTDQLLNMLDLDNNSAISSGASNESAKSDFLVIYSAIFATANYETAVAGGQS